MSEQPAAPDPITLRDIYQARQRIAGLAVRTPLIRSAPLSERAGADVYLKLENQQQTGSFKLRGAASKMLALPAADRARGVIAVSSGNHGRAVSYVAGELGLQAAICLAEGVAPNKLAAIRGHGAETVISGRSYDEAAAYADRLQQERGLTFVHPFDDRDVIAGQGTIGLEILEDLPAVDTVLVPLSGGGLISGIGLALKAASPAVRVVGVSMARAPVMAECLRQGRIVELPEEPTLADALVGGLGAQNHYTFALCRALVDETVLVTEEEIAEAMAFLLETHHQVVEGGGAVAAAALLGGTVPAGQNIAVIVSGGNVDLPLLLDIAQRRR